MKKTMYTICLLILFAGCNNNFENKTQKNKFSEERLDYIDSFLKDKIDGNVISGAEIILLSDNKVEYERTFGWKDVEKNIPLEKNSIYRLASLTKLVVIISVLQLYEKGYFMLNDPVSDYLPEFKNMKKVIEKNGKTSVVNCEKPILIRHLMCHTSGIGGTYYKKLGLKYEGLTMKKYMTSLSKIPLHFEPGEGFKYGSSTNVLVHLIETVSNMSFREYMIHNITRPLDMHETDFYVPKEKLGRLPQLYKYENDSLLLIRATQPIDTILPSIFLGDGNLFSTPLDYTKFLQMILNNGKYNSTHVLSRKSIELLRSIQLKQIPTRKKAGSLNGPGIGIALGIGIVSSLEEYGELGSEEMLFWGGNTGPHIWIDYNENVVGVLMMQTLNILKLKLQVRKLSYQALAQ